MRVTSAGQLSLPAEVRRRWQTRRVRVEDHGDHVVVRPQPEDPVEAAYGALAGVGEHTSTELREMAREDEARAERRRVRAAARGRQ